MDGTPQVATIPQDAQPQQTQASGNSAPMLDDIMKIIGGAASQTLPPATVTGHASNPILPHVNQSQPLNDQNRPISGSVYDIKHARRQNAFAGAVNAVQGLEKQIQQKHQDTVAHNVNTVLNAQHQIDSATQVINNPKATPQDKQNAQAVLDNNKKTLDRLFTDKKTANDLKKAFDVSFTDPEKNKTPEVQGMFAGFKLFQKSKNAGLNVDTPEEQRVQMLADGKTPASMNNGANVQSAQQSGLKVRGVDTPKSQTSYADQFLAQQMKTLEANPTYQAAVAQQQKAQEELSKMAIPLINERGANQRKDAELKEQDILDKRDNQAKKAVARMQAAARIKAARIEQAGAMDRLKTSINMREDIVNKKNQTPAVQQKLLLDQLKILQSGNAELSKQITEYEVQKAAIKGDKNYKGTDLSGYDELINKAKQQVTENNQRIKDTNTRLTNLGYIGALDVPRTDNTNRTTKTTNRTPVTNDNSSDSDDDETNSISDD